MVKPTFIKAQVASLTATMVDFGVTAILVKGCNIVLEVGTATGTTLGGITNFLLGRYWVFNSTKKKAYVQAGKYLMVWVGNLLLNTGGMTLMVRVFNVELITAKIFVSIIVGFTYNYFLQKKFVFKH